MWDWLDHDLSQYACLFEQADTLISGSGGTNDCGWEKTWVWSPSLMGEDVGLVSITHQGEPKVKGSVSFMYTQRFGLDLG